MLFYLLGWLIFGALVGWLAAALHPGKENLSFMGTVSLGVAGSFIGGTLNWLFGYSGDPFGASGFIMSVVGAILCCILYVNKESIKLGIMNMYNSIMSKIK